VAPHNNLKPAALRESVLAHLLLAVCLPAPCAESCVLHCFVLGHNAPNTLEGLHIVQLAASCPNLQTLQCSIAAEAGVTGWFTAIKGLRDLSVKVHTMVSCPTCAADFVPVGGSPGPCCSDGLRDVCSFLLCVN
jgi:hypothetical protein